MTDRHTVHTSSLSSLSDELKSVMMATKPPSLEVIDYRVPVQGDLYITKQNKLQRLQHGKRTSNKAEKKVIVMEVWE